MLSAYLRTNVHSTLMWGIFIFDETLKVQGLIGVSLVVLAGILAVRSSHRETEI